MPSSHGGVQNFLFAICTNDIQIGSFTPFSGAMTPASMSTGVRRKPFLGHNIDTTGPCDLAEPQDDGTGAEPDFLHTPPNA